MSVERAGRFVQDAYRLTEIGWALIPLKGKVPKGRDWQHTAPLRDPHQAAGLWAEWGKRWNMGVVLGPSGLCVVEYDRADAEPILLGLLGGGWPETPTVCTGSGRRHLYFEAPANGVVKAAREGLELRLGTHQCVLPPSEHPDTGREYVWEIDPWNTPLAAVSADVLGYFAEAADELRERLADPEAKVYPGQRRDQVFRLACSLVARGVPGDAILTSAHAFNKARCDPPLDDVQVVEQVDGAVERYSPATALPVSRSVAPASEEITSSSARKLNGEEFIFASPLEVPANWGNPGGEVIWAVGESLMIVGPDGVGKTTLAQQVVLGRLGITDELLALPIVPAEGRVLYLAMDRPAQAARSFRRMVDEIWHSDQLRERLAVWKGPPPVNVLKAPTTLADWIAVEFPDVSDVVIDSLKDLAPKLSDDEVGSKVNLARQELLARGMQVLEIHHQRKEQRGQGKPKTLADVYGSRWLTAGGGSVVLLWGEPGDLVVELRHLKQPADEIGPLRVLHDHVRGTSTIHEHADIEALLATSPNGLTVKDAARLFFECEEPKANHIEKARRKLESLVGRGRAERRDDPDGLVRYFAPSEGA